jgi:hypothetical protein
VVGISIYTLFDLAGWAQCVTAPPITLDGTRVILWHSTREVREETVTQGGSKQSKYNSPRMLESSGYYIKTMNKDIVSIDQVHYRALDAMVMHCIVRYISNHDWLLLYSTIQRSEEKSHMGDKKPVTRWMPGFWLYRLMLIATMFQ